MGSVITGLAVAIGLATIPGSPLYFSSTMIGAGQVGLFGLVAGVFFSGDAIASEFEHKTGYVLFLNPIRRTTLLLGKYVSCCIASALVISMPYLITSIGVIVGFGTLPAQVLQSYAFALLFVCSIVAFTFVFSSLLKGSMGASIVPFLTYLFVFAVIQALSMFAGFEPFMILSYGSSILGNILSEPYPEPVQTMSLPLPGGPPLQFTIYSATVAEGIIIMTSYLVIGLILSALLMKRRQMA
jgi:ABC-2 type transport system permease protein